MIPTGILRSCGHLDGGVIVSRERVTERVMIHLSCISQGEKDRRVVCFWFCCLFLSTCLFLAALSLSVAVHRLSLVATSICNSLVVAHGLSCSAAHGIFLDQGWNPCPLHWQADSQPLDHQGSPRVGEYCTRKPSLCKGTEAEPVWRCWGASVSFVQTESRRAEEVSKEMRGGNWS